MRPNSLFRNFSSLISRTPSNCVPPASVNAAVVCSSSSSVPVPNRLLMLRANSFSTSNPSEDLDSALKRFGVPDPVDPYLKYSDKYSKHRLIVRMSAFGSYFKPRLSRDSFVAPNATIIGNVELWDKTSVWYGCTIKGDSKLIRIGAFSNIQDRSVVEDVDGPLADDHDGSVIIGHYVTVGHACLLRACTVEDECLIGMGSVLDEGSYMETRSMLAAGSVLPAFARVPSGELWAGAPAKRIRALTDAEMSSFKSGAENYHELSLKHRDEFFLPYGTAYQQAERENLSVGWKEWPSTVCGK